MSITYLNFLTNKLIDEKMLEEFCCDRSINDEIAHFLISHPAITASELYSLIANTGISESFHKEHTIKHPKFDRYFLEILDRWYPNTDWTKLIDSNS